MKSIKVVALKGCNYCKALLTSLDSKEIDYRIIDADRNPTFCDNLEDALGITNYPIAIVENNGYVYYYHIVDDFENLKTKRLSPIAYSCGCYDVNDMVDNILNN